MREILFAALVLAACGSGGDRQDQGALQSYSAISAQPTIRPISDVVFPADYENWKSNFRARALSRGISGNVFDAMFAGTGVNTNVIDKDRNQAEFKKSIWEYVDGGTRAQRVALGQQMARQYGSLLRQIEGRYGVDPSVVLGIWGMETNYGTRMGNIPIAESLGTLAYDGRRRSFAEEQLMAALRIAQGGNAEPNRMLGSWAGAMGHTQFIPTSYIAYAQDFDGDGRRNLWEVADALASTANYLKQSGWVQGQPWGVEVIVPAGVGGGSASAGEWAARGVRPASGGALPPYRGRLFSPAGANGPQFLIYKNFNVIKRYNNADSYALAVGHLGDRVMGGGSFVRDWPWGENQLRSSEVLELQNLLNNLGYPIEKLDGVMGDETRQAIMGYQTANGMTVTGTPSRALLNQLRSR